MAGRGPAPKDDAVTRHVPTRGVGEVAPGVGWQHGDVPAPPEGLMPASLEAWSTWFAAWFAAFWTPADVPGIRHMIRLHDEVERGEFQRATELRMTMDTYGVTPKGQQDRRWKPLVDGAASKSATPSGGHYQRLRAV